MAPILEATTIHKGGLSIREDALRTFKVPSTAGLIFHSHLSWVKQWEECECHDSSIPA